MQDKLSDARNEAVAGMNALQQRDGRRALAAFKKAVSLGWPGADIWIATSFAHSLLGDFPNRLAALEKALDIEPGSARARLHYAQALVGAGRGEDARPHFERGLAEAQKLAGLSEEMRQLVEAARTHLGQQPDKRQEAVLDAFAAEHAVGSEPGDELFAQSLDILLGRKRPYVSQPTRYLYPGLPSRQFYPATDFTWTNDLASRTDAIRAELEGLLAGASGTPSGFAPYVEAGGRETTGPSHPLQDNPEWSAFYLVKQGHRIEENIARCPETMTAIDALGDDTKPAPAHSVLFSLLKPGARIPPHHGMLNTRLICHLPIILPGDCGFRVGNETREWKTGEVFIFDDTIEHEAWNNSAAPRYVLIFEIWHPQLSSRQRMLVSDLFARTAAQHNPDGK
ncbi:MAG: aspartyl/asparaginyl beta-hydroxylase domain-containing protein [Pseudomonadota bacterium]|nr:aspartyl/asparaginyl beta-hydroxylase domain-containing protein [Pseudomonadota bacterium]